MLLVSMLATGCGKDVQLVECQVGHVAGKFWTTTYELESDGLVRMWRNDRLFMWPKERIVACAEPGEEPGDASHGEFPTTVPATSAWSAPLGDGTERFAPSGFFSMAGYAGKCRVTVRAAGA